MISPDEIKTKAKIKYISLLQSMIQEIPFSKIIIRGDKTYSKSSLVDFEKEILAISSSSKEKKGFGYTLEFQKVKTKHLGTQDIPIAIYFDSEKDLLKYLDKEKEFAFFKLDCEKIISTFPELKDWAFQNPSKIIQNQPVWEGILKVCFYFKNNPKPNLYIRELPVSVHTKFIEHNKSVLRELLNLIIEPHINSQENDFEKRFNLKYSEPLVRFKVLDKNLSQTYFSGIDDISIPVSQFDKLKLPLKKVLIVENKTTLYTTLTLSKMEKTIAIFGQGNAVSNIQNTKWLNEIMVLYWGDIDVHGFEMLSMTRRHFAQTQSILMDRATFDKFFENEEGKPSTNTTELILNEKERELYELLKTNNWRLEQEKIPSVYVNEYFHTM